MSFSKGFQEPMKVSRSIVLGGSAIRAGAGWLCSSVWMPPNIAIHLIRHLKATSLPKYALRPGDGSVRPRTPTLYPVLDEVDQ
jgi:hypothetical protein